ncbi:amidohydrolase, partial [Thermococcus sp.]|uniref:M20 metallopeptidase family protein n=1 Tax=Thermococcus sp. TaxID=35749 RepID=UPI00262623D5
MNPIEEALKIREQIIAWRRDFHMHPELGYEEERTSKIVEGHLREWGYRIKRIGTGIIADIGRGKKTIALRADMDALPIQEENNVPYKSKIPGKMHACGHDAHTAMLLGAAEIIASHKDGLKGRVRLIFQPAEEGGNGAVKMVEGGALEGVDAIFGFHVWMDLPSGIIGIQDGPFLAGAGIFGGKITGKGGHGASPHEAVDPIPITAEAVLAFQTIVSRNVPPIETGVVSVTSVHGGTAFNVIPEEVEFKGTFRFFKPEIGELIQRRMHEILEGITKAHGAKYELSVEELTP